MRKLGIIIIGLMMSSLIQAQSLETVVKAWLDDASNGFHNVFEKYGRNCGGYCVDIDGMHSSYGTFTAFLEIKPNGSLEASYNTIKSQMSNWSFLKAWETSSSVYYDHNISYKTAKPNGEKWTITLKIDQNYEGTKPKILSLSILKTGLKKPAVMVPDKETKPLVQTVANPSIVSLKSRLADQDAKKALQQLMAAADNDFEDIILKNTLQNGVYQVQPGYLNPKSDKPFITVKEEPQKRTLTLRFQVDNPRNSFVFLDLFFEPYSYNTLFTKTEWNVRESDMWQAAHKSKPYLIVKKAYEKNLDVLEIVAVKKAYRRNLAINPDLAKNDCLEGNCLNGFGIMRYTQDDRPFRYEGNFRNGKFQGIGFVYLESSNGLTLIDLERNRQSNDLLLFIGHHQNGKRQGKGLSYAYANFKDPVRSFREKSEFFQKEDRTGVFNYIFQNYEADTLHSESLHSFTYHKTSADTYHSIEQPFTTDFGQCVSGNCQNGTGVLKIDKLGNYEGQFINGQANGQGILKMATGEWKLFEAYQGIPKFIRTIKLPSGVSRLAAAKRMVWLLADNDCISGNCYNGQGLQLRVSADRFRRYNVTHRGFMRANFQNGVAEGGFTIMPLTEPKAIVDGTFKRGVFNGTLTVKYLSESTPRKEYYQMGRRVTEDGQDYATYLEEQREQWQNDYERKLREAMAQGLAERKQREAEARKIAAAAQAKKTNAGPKIYSCNSCRGTGSYWNETITQDCTTTYDFRYSHGKHYKTSSNCRDVSNGNYVVCPVCNGKGRYSGSY